VRLNPARMAVALALCAAAGLAEAGRPLETDDAGVAETGTCQIETWRERGKGFHSTVLGAACSPVANWEIGVEGARGRSGGERERGAGLGLKWAPAGASELDTPLGELSFGLKLDLAADRSAGEGWRREGSAAALLATLEAGKNLNLHANLALERERGGGTEPSLRLAAEWSPAPWGLLFGETRVAKRKAGGNTVALGGRYWAVPERLGLDLTARREAGGGVTWGLGLGWYDLR
jgi:hypothetical protein